VKNRPWAAMLAVIALVATACGGAATPDPTSAPAPIANTAPTTASTTAPPAATRTPNPTATPVPTIGLPADDGARIIAVDAKVIIGSVPVTRARDLKIDSPAVGRIVQVRLLLPKDFEARASTRWPVLYLLDGQSGAHDGWTNELIDVTPLFAPTDLLVVMPDCGSDDPGGCSYTDWWNGGTGGTRQWETFHLVELRQLLERNWQAGDRRAIAGVSAGGYGAIEYAARQPGLFRFAASYSGVSDPLGNVAFWNPPRDVWGDPVAQADIWKAHDPFLNAAALKGTALYIAYGNGKVGPLDYLNENGTPWDPGGAVERECGIQSAALVQRLKELKIPVTAYAYGNGTHSNPYIWRDLQRSLPLILKALGE
jgi:diacylglycerol O-acyltransferase / trehalose O-mycolyltransferase / mycolyltransferase Ag85